MVDEKVDDEEEEIFSLDDKSSISMAADTLFAIMEIATRKEDTDTLLNVTAAWLEINSRFSGHDDEERRGPIGFNSEHSDAAQTERVNEDDKSNSESRIYKKYGKFRIMPRGHWRGR